MFSLLLASLPTTIGVAEGVSAARKEKDSQDSDDLLRKFTLVCRVSPPSSSSSSASSSNDAITEKFHGGGVGLRENKVYVLPRHPLPAAEDHRPPSQPPHPRQPPSHHPLTGFLIAYPDPSRPQPAPLGLVSAISDDPPVLNWVYVDAATREVRYGNRTQSRAHVVGSWGRGGGWLELKGGEVGEKLGGGGKGGSGGDGKGVGGKEGEGKGGKGEGERWWIGKDGAVMWGEVGEGDEGVEVRLERVFVEGPVEEKGKEEGKGEGEGGRSKTKVAGGATVLEMGTKKKK